MKSNEVNQYLFKHAMQLDINAGTTVDSSLGFFV